MPLPGEVGNVSAISGKDAVLQVQCTTVSVVGFLVRIKKVRTEGYHGMRRCIADNRAAGCTPAHAVRLKMEDAVRRQLVRFHTVID